MRMDQWITLMRRSITVSEQAGLCREVVELFEASFQENLVHVNTKRIQTNEFEADKGNKNVRVLQMDFAMAYKCMYQQSLKKIVG